MNDELNVGDILQLHDSSFFEIVAIKEGSYPYMIRNIVNGEQFEETSLFCRNATRKVPRTYVKSFLTGRANAVEKDLREIRAAIEKL